MKIGWNILLFIILSPMLIQKVYPQGGLEPSIQSIVDGHVREKNFSGTVLIAHHGEIIFHRSYGMANIQENVQVQNDFHFAVASVTKLFTAIRILQVAESGQLSLDSPVIEYLPGLRSLISRKVTPHHLLLHISGLPNEPEDIYRSKITAKDYVLKSLSREAGSIFGEFNYNNVDYVILGLLVESITGNRWEDEIQDHILKPLDMTNTGMLKNGSYPGKFAVTYTLQNGDLKKDPNLFIENYFSAGNMYSTAQDLLKLDQALYDGTLLNSESLSRLSKSYPEFNYVGYGVWNYNYPFLESNPELWNAVGEFWGQMLFWYASPIVAIPWLF